MSLRLGQGWGARIFRKQPERREACTGRVKGKLVGQSWISRLTRPVLCENEVTQKEIICAGSHSEAAIVTPQIVLLAALPACLPAWVGEYPRLLLHGRCWLSALFQNDGWKGHTNNTRPSPHTPFVEETGTRRTHEGHALHVEGKLCRWHSS